MERTASHETASTSAIAVRSPVSGDSTMAEPMVPRPCQTTADQGMAAAGRDAEPPGDHVPGDRAGQGAEDDGGIDDARVHHAAADGRRDMEAEHGEGDAAVLSGVETLLDPVPTHAAAS